MFVTPCNSPSFGFVPKPKTLDSVHETEQLSTFVGEMKEDLTSPYKLDGRPSQNVWEGQPATPATSALDKEATDPLKSTDPYKPDESFLDKPFLPQKPVPQSPKISPSSIPNPNPSVSTSKIETYPNYGNYLYSIPGYSAFQPVSYPGVMQPQTCVSNETISSEYVPFPSVKDKVEEKAVEANTEAKNNTEAKEQTDFEEQFTPEIIPAVSLPEVTRSPVNDFKINVASSQASNIAVTQPQVSSNNETKKKPPEKFSLKTSIPISKIDMKCVNAPETSYQNSLVKKPVPFNPAFANTNDDATKVEIQSNIVIKNALKESEGNARYDNKTMSPGSSNINALISAAEAIKKTDSFRIPDSKTEVINEVKDPPNFSPLPVFNTNSTENTNASKPPDGAVVEQKSQILFIQNKPQSNQKMLLTIQQQNPQVLLQRTNLESKNLPAPSRLSSQSKRCKEDIIENGTASKVVALKRLHQENCDENDFENLITENQIYGNKIVVKEKSQGTQQEQDLKKMNKLIENKTSPGETKNVVLQPNFLYLSNVQFPNLMMLKSNPKIHHTNDSNRPKFHTTNENKNTSEASTMTNNEIISNSKINTTTMIGKDIQVFKSNNNVLQTLSNKNDIVFQKSHPKVIMNSQIVYQVPMIVDADNKIKQTFNRDYPNFVGHGRKDYVKPFDPKPNEKLYIACPYQMDSKLKPKIVITNIRPKIAKVDEVSTLDLYEKRKRMRRLKHLTHRDLKDGLKVDLKKNTDKTESSRNIITPDRMREEIAREFANTKVIIDETCSESGSDLEDNALDQYQSIIREYEPPSPHSNEKIEFLANFRLASYEDYKEKQMERQEKIIKRDSVASAYIAVGRIDRLSNETAANEDYQTQSTTRVKVASYEETRENGSTLQRKIMFFSQLKLGQVSTQYKKDYEKTWQEIVKDRKRRNGEIDHILKQPNLKTKKVDFNTNDQLKMLTEIKKSVNENNNLIKKRLDSGDESLIEGESISMLAEKNFCELNRLSKMADRSVKLITGQEKKRDLNPGFDSENIKIHMHKFEQPFQKYPQINIPNMSKIVTLKSQETMTSSTMTSQATSMDEPKSSAAGATEIPNDTLCERIRDVGIQVEECTWPGLEAIMKTYKEFEAARKKETSDLHRRNTMLRVEGAYITRQAGRDADRARALLAELRHLANEEATTRVVLDKLYAAIRVIRNCN